MFFSTSKKPSDIDDKPVKDFKSGWIKILAGVLDSIGVIPIIGSFTSIFGAFILLQMIAKTYNYPGRKVSVLKRFEFLSIIIIGFEIMPFISALPLWTTLVWVIDKLEKK